MNQPYIVRTNSQKRKVLVKIAVSLFMFLGITYSIYWQFFSQQIAYTNDAYVTGNIVQITPQVAGVITEIRADNTEFIKAGSPLITLDSIDAQLAFNKACAQLAQSVRQAKHLILMHTELEERVKLRKYQLGQTKAEVIDNRNLPLTPQQYNRAKLSEAEADAEYQVALKKFNANQALILDGKISNQPFVQAAAIQVRETYLTLHRTKILSPVSGYLARRIAQVGQRVNIGQNLMSVVPLDHDIWVNANFKEVQLANIRIGQPVKLTADVYGKAIIYKGYVEGIGIGTGDAFSLLPSQNALGNWIKVVQRVPVRIMLDTTMLKSYPLRIGLSMEVEVDTRDQSGPTLAITERQGAKYTTHVFEESAALNQVDKIINQIITKNAR